MLKDQNNIVQGCQQFKPESQQALYEKFASKMLGVCLRYAHNREEAKDLMHEGFLKIFSSISQYRGEGSLEGWIRRVMINTSLMHLRKNKKIIFESIDSNENYPNLQNDQEDVNEANEILELKTMDFSEEELITAINTLPANNKLIFNLYYMENYSHKEIGELLGINEVTSRTRLLRSRKLMQKYLINLCIEKRKNILSNTSVKTGLS